jgi:transglutaminase-like putative cysteine protease
VEGADAFEFIYQATLPEFHEQARMWIPFPESDALQTVQVKSIQAPGRRQVLTDRRYGNKVLFLTLEPLDSGQSLDLRFHVERREKQPYRDPGSRPDAFLAPERLVPGAPEFEAIATEVLAGKKSDLVRARAIYDHAIDRMRYMRYGSGWGRGDAVYACDSGTGNCTDYHAYFIALCRAAGIPARFGIGAAIPSERDEGGIDGYHCWAEFYAEEKWWPVDLSEADKYSSLSTYYFGRHPANRIELSRGRDLEVEPGPESGPLNFLADPVLEVAGKPVAIKPQYSFRRTSRALTEPPA